MSETAGGLQLDLSSLLGHGLASLDPTPEEHELAVRRYTDLAAVIDEHWDAHRGEDRVFPQGSFRLGTVTRTPDGVMGLDIDCVALRDLQKSSITQEELKALVGRAVKDYATRSVSGFPQVVESDRCWTLVWPSMHLDVLPALPAEGTDGLLITDRALREWQSSDPEGYAEWFFGRMKDEFRAERMLVAKALEVEDVPEWRVKTSLQRSVQALKRHRDVYFADRPADRPASIVITTLAALAYSGGATLIEVLQQITGRMPQLLQQVDGQWWLANPVQPAENFCDYWNTDPALPTRFFEWLSAAVDDFDELASTRGLDRISERMTQTFGAAIASRATGMASDTVNAARIAGTLAAAAGSAGLVLAPSAPAAATGRAARPNHFHGGPAL